MSALVAVILPLPLEGWDELRGSLRLDTVPPT